MSPDDAQIILAEWRRAGYGVWKLIFIVEGFDDEWIHLMPGRLSERRAKKFATKECAQEHDVKPRHVHLQSMEKMT